MNRGAFLKTVPAFAMLATKGSGFAREPPTTSGSVPDLQPILLPKPEKDGGKSVLAALWERKTNRNVSDKMPEMSTCSPPRKAWPRGFTTAICRNWPRS